MNASQGGSANTEQLIADLKAVVSHGEELLKASSERGGADFATMKEKFAQQLRATRAGLERTEQAIVDQAKASARATDEYVHSHPWPAIGVGAGVGLLVGLLIGRR
jgi:ElaB/YqjD/DUF883 family membrane-anchored ribosome-binding protein